MIRIRTFSSFFLVMVSLCIISFNYNTNISKIVISEPISSKLGTAHDENIGENDSVYSVMIKYSYPALEIDERNYAQSDLSVSEILTAMRLDNKNYYYYNNMDYTYDLNIHGNIYVSKYSPYVEMNFTTLQELSIFLDDFEETLNDDKIDSVIVFENKTELGYDRNTSATTGPYPLQDAFNDVGITNHNNLDGSNIKIGIFDGGSPHDLSNLMNNEINLFIDEYNGISADPSEHASIVSNIIAGDVGISKNAELYFANALIRAKWMESMEWFIDQGVQLINMSIWYEDAQPGLYTFLNSYFDFMIRKNKLIIVGISGNGATSNNHKISSPSKSLNMLSVGSISLNGKISYFSDYALDPLHSNIIIKPNLVAPGENLIIPNLTITEYPDVSGTSYSAPIVTGIIALLMEEFPKHQLHPEIYIAALLGGAKKVESNPQKHYEKAGSGIVNYDNARNILLANSIHLITTHETTFNNQEIFSKDISLEVGGYFKSTMVMTINGEEKNPNDDFNGTIHTVMTPNFTKYKLSITDKNTGLILKSDERLSNIFEVEYTNNSQSVLNLRLSISLNGPKIGYFKENGAMVIQGTSIHEHSYSTFPNHYITNTHHTGECHCGHLHETNHWVYEPRFQMDLPRYVNCQDCRKLVDTYNYFIIVKQR